MSLCRELRGSTDPFISWGGGVLPTASTEYLLVGGFKLQNPAEVKISEI